MRTATLEIGAKGISNNQTYTISGVSYGSWTLSGEQGAELQATTDFIGENITRGTSLTGYTPDSLSTFNFNSGSVSWNGEELACTNFNVTSNYTSNHPREVFSRFVKQPTKGVRRYNWTLTLTKHFDDTAATISATELIDEFFGTSNTPITSGTISGRDLNVNISEGNDTGDREAVIQLADSYINDWAENPAVEGGIVSVTVNGFSLKAQKVSGNNSPLKWWTK